MGRIVSKKLPCICVLMAAFLFTGCYNNIYNRTRVDFISPRINKFRSMPSTLAFLPLIVKPLDILPKCNSPNIAEVAAQSNYDDLTIAPACGILERVLNAGKERYYLDLCNTFLRKAVLDDNALKRLKIEFGVNYIVIACVQKSNILRDFKGIYCKRIFLTGALVDMGNQDILWRFTSVSASRSRFKAGLADLDELIKDIWLNVDKSMPRDPKRSIVVPSALNW